jgi:Zn-dependent protease
MNPEFLAIRALTLLLGVLFSVTLHECAHAWMAGRLGDRGPERDGRLTLNPVPHLDPVGTLAWPLISAVLGGPGFGWGRPVDWSPSRFRRDVPERRGTILVALAGPLANLLLAVACALVAGTLVWLAPRAPGLRPTLQAFGTVLALWVPLNVMMMLIHLVPLLPMLDGFRILEAVLGAEHPAVRWIAEHPLLMLLAALLFLGPVLALPFAWTMSALMPLLHP